MNKRPKILHINKMYFPWIGGVESVAQDIVEGLSDYSQGEVLVCQSKGVRKVNYVNDIRVTRAASLGMVLGMPLSLDFLLLFRSEVKNKDIVFLHHPFPLGFLAWFLFARNIPLVVWYHSDILRQKIANLFFKPILSYALKRSKVIFVSSKGLLLNSQVLNKYADKVKIVPFGIDVDEYRGDRGAIEKKAEVLRKSYGSPLILSVGRLVYYKGFSYLVRAMLDVDARLLIIGSGSLKNNLSNLIKRLGLGSRVTIIDHVEDLRPYYQASDLFVFPSTEKTEAFGIVQLEAMAYGKPVVNTNLPTGVPELIVSGESGITVPPKDENALGEAINKILRDDRLRIRMGQEALSRLESNFSKRKFYQEIIKSLSSISS